MASNMNEGKQAIPTKTDAKYLLGITLLLHYSGKTFLTIICSTSTTYESDTRLTRSCLNVYILLATI